MTKSPPGPRASECLTYTEAMRESGIPKATLHHAVTRGHIKYAETAGGTKLIIRESLRQYAMNRPKVGRPPTNA